MIEVRERLRPFSHSPGIRCLIPQTGFVVQAFPALLKISDIQGRLLKEKCFSIEGPLNTFTLFQDLERGCVTLHSEKYHVHVLPDLEIVEGKNVKIPLSTAKERLSFGIHKKQEWEGIKKRLDFKEICPIWFQLGSLLNLPPFSGVDTGMFSLLADLKKTIELHKPEKIIPALKKLFLAGFDKMMVPRLHDDDFQGILPQNLAYQGPDNPLYLLQQGAILIRSFFLKSNEKEIFLLPNMPPEFFSGRMVEALCPKLGLLDFEWTKKTLRKVRFRSSKEGSVVFHFPSSLKTFRLRESKKERGHFLKCGTPLEIKSDTIYLLDQFQK